MNANGEAAFPEITECQSKRGQRRALSIFKGERTRSCNSPKGGSSEGKRKSSSDDFSRLG